MTDWDNIRENYAFAYMPEIFCSATANTRISLSTVFLDGKGDNLFASMKNDDMLLFRLEYIF